MTQSAERAINVVGMVVLIALVAAVLFWWILALWFDGGILSPLALGSHGSERAGIELVVIPVAAVAGVLARHRLRWVSSLHTRRVGPYLPLLTVAVVFGLASYWAWAYSLLGDELWGLRGLGAVLAAGAMFVGVNLYPRVFATLAGALGAAAVFAGIAFFCIRIFGSASVERVLTYGEASEYLVPVYFLLTIGLFAAAWVLRAMNLDPPPWTPRAWTSATLPATCPSTLIAASAVWSAGLTLIFIVAGLEAPLAALGD